MTTPLVPPFYVEPPAAPPASYGLFAASVGPVDMPSEHAIGGGVEFVPDYCTEAHLYPSPCDFGAIPVPTKVFDPADPEIVAPPFRVYASVLCGSMSFNFEESRARAIRRLAAAEQKAVESQFWGLPSTDNFPSYLRSGAIAVTGLAAAASVVAGIAALEQQMADCYGHPALIHMRPRLAAYLAANHQIFWQAPVWRTARGSTVVFGDGYSGLGVADAPPGAATEWMYATGRVHIWRSADVHVPDPRQTFDRAVNQVKVIAERDYAMGVECCAAAVQVTIP